MRPADGLALQGADFRRVFVRPRALLIGLVGQLVLVPLVALAVVLAFDLPPLLGMGLMVLAACPGGATSVRWNGSSASWPRAAST